VVAEVAANDVAASNKVATMRNKILNRDVISGSLKNLLPRVSLGSHCQVPEGEPWRNSQSEVFDVQWNGPRYEFDATVTRSLGAILNSPEY